MFPTTFLCTGPTAVREGDNPARTFSNTHKIAIVFDVFLSALAITAGLLTILAIHGVNLGPLNAFSQFSLFSGKIMIAAGLVLIAFETLCVLVLMCKHISKLQALKKSVDDSVENLREDKSKLEDEVRIKISPEDHVKEMDSLRKQHRRASTALNEQAEAKVKDLKAKTETALLNAEAHIKNLDAEIAALKQQLSATAVSTSTDLNAEKVKWEQEKQQLIAEIQKNQMAVTALSDQYKDAIPRAAAESTLQKANARIADLEGEIALLNKKLVETSFATVRDKDIEKEKSDKEKQQLITDLNAKETELTTLKAKLLADLQDRDTELVKWKTQAENFKNETENLKKLAQEATIAAKANPIDLVTIEDDKKLLEQIANLTNELNQAKAERDNLVNQAQIQSNQMKEMTTKHEEALQNLTGQLKLQDQADRKTIEDLEDEAKGLKGRISLLEKEKLEAETKVKLQGTLEDLINKATQLQNEVNALATREDLLKADLTALETQAAESEKAIKVKTELDARLNEALAKLKKESTDVKQESAQVKNELETLNKQKTDLEEQNRLLIKQGQELEAEIEKLKKQKEEEVEKKN